MKKLLFVGSMLAALVMTVGIIGANARADSNKSERVTVEFTQTVKLMGVFLKGEYFFVHDEERMARGEDCTYVYDRSGKLVVSFHCTPVERPKSDVFRVVTARIENSTGLDQIREIQFPGSTEAHRVP